MSVFIKYQASTNLTVRSTKPLPDINPECILTKPQQELVLDSFGPRQRAAEPKISMFEAYTMQHYLMPDIIQTNRFKTIDSLIDQGAITTEPYLKIMDSVDGVVGEILNTKMIKNVQNNTNIEDIQEEIQEFLNAASSKSPGYIHNFLHMMDYINEDVTDICMIYGRAANSRDSPHKEIPIFLIYLFIEDRYVLSYTSTPIKSKSLSSRVTSVVTYKSLSNEVSCYKIPLSTFKKKTPQEIENLTRHTRVNQRGFFIRLINNIQGDGFMVGTLRTLSGVI